MSKFTLELDVKELIGRLPIEERIRLVKDLERETWAKRLDAVVKRIRKRFKKHPISSQEITAICDEVRQRNYEKNKRGN